MTFLIYCVPIFISAVVAYLIGSVNTAIIVTKVVTKGGNIKEMGSKNAGFTNVLRCVGKGPAIVTIVCDFLKAVISALLAMGIFALGTIIMTAIFGDASQVAHIAENPSMYAESMSICMYIAGYCCILGHMFPIYFNFMGGKGVVAAIGMILILDWRVFLIILGIFLIIFLCSKIISLGSLICAALYGPITFVITYFFSYKPSLVTKAPLTLSYVFAVSAIALLAGITVIIKHHENIKRLIHGEEKKIKAKK